MKCIEINEIFLLSRPYVPMGHYSIYSRMQRNILHCMRKENIASGPWASDKKLNCWINSWVAGIIAKWVFNPFHATVIFQYPLETSEDLWFSDIYKGYRKRPEAWNRLINAKLLRIHRFLPFCCSITASNIRVEI